MQTDLIRCERYPDRTFFSFVNLFNCIRTPVNMVFMPDDTVIVVVGGAQYRCKSDLVTVLTDLTSVDCKKLEDLTYSIKADQLSFCIPYIVYTQLVSYSEFCRQEVISHTD